MTGAAVCRTGTLRAGLAGGRRRGCVGVVRGAGRRGSVACGVAQRALLCAFMFVPMSFLHFKCILALFVFVCLCAAEYGVIKKGWIIIVRSGGRHQKGDAETVKKCVKKTVKWSATIGVSGFDGGG